MLSRRDKRSAPAAKGSAGVGEEAGVLPPPPSRASGRRDKQLAASIPNAEIWVETLPMFGEVSQSIDLSAATRALTQNGKRSETTAMRRLWRNSLKSRSAMVRSLAEPAIGKATASAAAADAFRVPPLSPTQQSNALRRKPRLQLSTLSKDWWGEVRKAVPARPQYTRPVVAEVDKNAVRRHLLGRFHMSASSQTFFRCTIPAMRETFVVDPDWESEVRNCYNSSELVRPVGLGRRAVSSIM